MESFSSVDGSTSFLNQICESVSGVRKIFITDSRGAILAESSEPANDEMIQIVRSFPNYYERLSKLSYENPKSMVIEEETYTYMLIVSQSFFITFVCSHDANLSLLGEFPNEMRDFLHQIKSLVQYFWFFMTLICVRVVTDSATFYPLEKPNDENRHKNDDMTLLTTLSYMKEQMKEDFNYYVSGDMLIVLEYWKGMLFMTKTKLNIGFEVMKDFIAHLRSILVFLFGIKYENFMRRNISCTKRQVFAKYVDSYIEMVSGSPRYLLRTITCSDIGPSFKRMIADSNIPNFPDNGGRLLSIVLFSHTDFLCQVAFTKESTLDPETILILQLFLRIETAEDERLGYQTPFDAESMPELKHKRANIKIGDTISSCTLSYSQCGSVSPYYVVAITENSKITPECQQQIREYLIGFIRHIKGIYRAPMPISIPSFSDELIYYVAINRTTGFTWELPKSTSMSLISLYEIIDFSTAANQRYDSILSQLITYSESAISNGFFTMMWGEDDYQYCYQLLFENIDGELVLPLSPINSKNNDNFSKYKSIVDCCFNGDQTIRCSEIISVYRSSIQIEEANLSNQLIYAYFKKIQ